jgi:threonine/homoserine/homoserine lactone efflux protein
MILFLKSIFLGFSLAAPVGPIGLLCIRRTLTQGWLMGFISGLGAATADMLYAAAAGFGLTFITDFILHQRFLLTFLGSIVLCIMGIHIFMTPPPTTPSAAPSHNIIQAFFSTFFLTLGNPLTILAFIALLASLEMHAATSQSLVELMSGIFVGSMLWWLMLNSIVTIARAKLNEHVVALINKGAGIALIGFSIATLTSLWWH